jgi:hypothetical protein
LPELAPEALHDATPVGPVVFVAHVVVVQPLPEVAAVGVHAEAGVGPVALVTQVVVV